MYKTTESFSSRDGKFSKDFFIPVDSIGIWEIKAETLSKTDIHEIDLIIPNQLEVRIDKIEPWSGGTRVQLQGFGALENQKVSLIIKDKEGIVLLENSLLSNSIGNFLLVWEISRDDNGPFEVTASDAKNSFVTSFSIDLEN